jgi:SAM-dependent methyltransferase
MDAEKTKFNDNVFDLVIGTGIIHHLNILNSYKEISRILNDDGHAIFIEPLGHNPLINLYRKLTPEMRTKDEHPLKINDIKLMEQYFHDVHIEYYSLFVLFAVPIRKLWFFKKIYNILKIVDEIVLRFPFIRRYAWTILIHAHRPKIN